MVFKKNTKYLKKFFTLIIIISIIILPFGELSKIYAQQSGGYSISGSYPTSTGITGGGISSYIEILSPAISQLPLCREAISSKIKNLFRGAPDAIKPPGDKAETDLNPKEISLDLGDLAESYEATNIGVIDQTVRNELEAQQKTLYKVQEGIVQIKENDTCLKSIAKLIIKTLLQKITLSTVEWINNGAHGKPFFLKEPGKFFEDIANEEFLKFKLEISDPTLYPFGRAFLKARVNQLNNKFAYNARYSLNELIQETTPEYSASTFSVNFSQGGWAAWDALTQVPANNPLGFNILASSELAFRLQGTSKSKAQQTQEILDQSGGFLGDERCKDPEGITRAEHMNALAKGDAEGVCKIWEYITPGKTIADFATKITKYPDNAYLEADDLNTAIATIIDAAVNKFIPELANKGLAYLDTVGADGSFIYDENNSTGNLNSQVDQDFPKSFTNSSWLRENPDFNIRTDLTQALIDEQRIYQQRLEDENRVLNDLITTVRQLDYCIPGPHPDWENDSEIYLASEIKKIPLKTLEDMENWSNGDIATAVSGVLDIFTQGLFSPIKGIIDGILGVDKYSLLSKYYASIILGITGIPLDAKDTKLSGKNQVYETFETIFSRYQKLIKKYYHKDLLPKITPQAKVEFRKIVGYEEKIRNNEFIIYSLTSTINRLSQLKDRLDEMNPDSNTYEDYLPMINEFGRLSSSMVTGNDIAKVIEKTKEETSKLKYVYNDLLTGPYGCEKELEKRLITDLNKTDYKILSTLRASYPFPIWYDYNKLAPYEEIPSIGENGSLNNPVLNLAENERDMTVLAKYGVNTNIKNKMPEWHAGPFVDETEIVKERVVFLHKGGPLNGQPGYFYVSVKKYKDPKSEVSNAFGPGFLSRIAYDFETEKEVAVDCREYANDASFAASAQEKILDCLTITDLYIGVNRWPTTVGRKQGDTHTGETKDKNRNRFHSFEQVIGVY